MHDFDTLAGRAEAEAYARALDDGADSDERAARAVGFGSDRAVMMRNQARVIRARLATYYATSRYGSVTAEQAEQVLLDGFAEEQAGSVDEGGHYALVYVDVAPLGHQWVILATDSQGFVDVHAEGASRSELEGHWSAIVAAEYARDEDGPGELSAERLAIDAVEEPAETGRAAYVVVHPDRPTFYLLVDVQGITSTDHARRIARDVLGIGPDGDGRDLTVAKTTI